jgi:hypothetical protein
METGIWWKSWLENSENYSIVVNSGAIGIEFLVLLLISFSNLLLPNLEIRFTISS